MTEELTGQGRAIFYGRGDDARRIVADLDGRRTVAAILPCANCHGRDGAGRREAEADAPAIFRGEGGLDETGMTTSGAIRPAYDLAAFVAAVTGGIGTDGRALSKRMPRYGLQPQEAEALWHWLKALPAEQRQGVGTGRLAFSVIAPENEKLAAAVAALLAQMASAMRPPYGMRLDFTPSGWSLREPGCPGEGALAVIAVGLDREHALLERAGECLVPVIVAFDMLAGSEADEDLRAIRPSLADHWRALRTAAGAGAGVLATVAPTAWEQSAISGNRLAPQPSRNGAHAYIAPLGLDRSVMPDSPAEIFAPEAASMASLEKWRRAGHEIHLSRPDIPAASREDPRILAIAATLALADRAVTLAGPGVTRASFIEAFNRIDLQPAGWMRMDYASARLTGSRAVMVVPDVTGPE